MNLVHMFKKFGQGIVVFMLVCLFSFYGKTEAKAATSTYYETIDGIEWTAVVSSDGTVAVKPYNKSEISGIITIPETVAGYTVTAIKNNAFNECSNLTGIEIPDAITVIDTCAFRKCSSLTQVAIPPNLCEIGQEVFQDTGLVSVTIPSNVKTLGWEAFDGCTSLTTVTIESGVEKIGKEAFSNCTSLTNITLPETVNSFGADVFYGCSNFIEINVDSANPYYTSTNGVLLDKTETTLICYPYGQSTSYQIPEGVERIESYAFYHTNIASISIPSTIKSIGAYAFYRCTKLTSISIDADLTKVEKDAFFSCSNLSSFTITGNIDEIGEYGFGYCSSLTNFNISGEIGSIGNYAFMSCRELKNAPLTEGLTVIGNSAFLYCNALDSINIPSTLSSIGKLAFYATNLQQITVSEANQFYCSINNVLFDKNVTELILCANSKTGCYEVPVGVTVIEDAAFYKCADITNIVIPDGVINIGSSAFESCENLTSLTIPEGVTSIESSLCRGCLSLRDVTIPDSVESIGDNAFDECSSLTSITIPEKVGMIGTGAFEGCTNLEIVVMPSVWDMGYNAFGYREEMNIETVYYLGNKLQWDSLVDEDSPLRDSSNIYYIGAQVVTNPVFAQYANSQEEAVALTVDALKGEDKDGNAIGTLSYQWYSFNTDSDESEGTPIDNATSSSYIPVLEPGIIYYYCVVTNTYNGISAKMQSDLAMISVGY